MLFFLIHSENWPRVRRVKRQRLEDLPMTLIVEAGEVSTKLGRFRNGVYLGPENVYVSPLLNVDLTLDDFPNETVFTDEAVRLLDVKRVIDGQEIIIAVETRTIICPYELILSSSELNRLREIFEGIPFGNPEQNVWRPFARDGALEPDLVPELLTELKARSIAELTLSDLRIIKDLEVLNASTRIIPPLPEPPLLTESEQRLSRIAKLQAISWSAWTTNEMRELIDLIAQEITL